MASRTITSGVNQIWSRKARAPFGEPVESFPLRRGRERSANNRSVLCFNINPDKIGDTNEKSPILLEDQWRIVAIRGYIVKFYWRRRADSNRRKRFCRPLPSHSVTTPNLFEAKLYHNSLIGSNIAYSEPAIFSLKF